MTDDRSDSLDEVPHYFAEWQSEYLELRARRLAKVREARLKRLEPPKLPYRESSATIEDFLLFMEAMQSDPEIWDEITWAGRDGEFTQAGQIRFSNFRQWYSLRFARLLPPEFPFMMVISLLRLVAEGDYEGVRDPRLSEDIVRIYRNTLRKN